MTLLSAPALALPINSEETESVIEPGGSLILQTRLIKAPRDRVWAAWTEPTMLGQWWGPKGFSITTQLFEFRVGGHWVFTMHGPDPDPQSKNPGGPRDFPCHIVWTRIERNTTGSWYLEYHHVEADKLDSVFFKTQVILEEKNGHTLLKWRADFGSNAVRDEAIRYSDGAKGGRETTARLAHLMEGKDFDIASKYYGHRLVLARVLPVRRELVWRVWTDPELLKQWFCPKPFAVDRCVLDLRAGGRFYTHMTGPNNWESDNEGCYLEVIPNERLAFTDLMHADWTPAPAPEMRFTATLTFEDTENGKTKYTAIARHTSFESSQQHAQMGFHDGWGTATDQLVELISNINKTH